MMGSKKAQMTTFIILGVVIVLFSSLGFFLYKQVTVSDFEKKADTVAEQMKITSLDTYVESCLREALLESIDSVGLRGGFLGRIQNEFTNRGAAISVAIPPFEQYNRGTPPEYPPPPAYPDRVITKEDGTKETASFHIQPIRPYPFGGLSFPKLCQIGGPNDVPLQEFARPCPRGSYGSESIQQELNVQVALGLDACVNDSYIEDITGYDVDVGAPIVGVIFGEDDVRAEAEYPINITLSEGTAVRTFDFATDVSIRLKRVYGLAQHIINNDRFYVTYNKSDVGSPEWRSEFWDHAMTVSVDCCPEDMTDVVTITDTRSDVGGKYLLFRFAVSDRIPVLEPIKGPSASGEFDFVLTDGATLTIEPFALDPDEDEVRIFYRGWHQDRITIDHERVGLRTDRYTRQGDEHIPQIPAGPCVLDLDDKERRNACDAVIVIDNVIIDRDSDRRISSPHRGDHILTIIACDPSGDPDDLANPDNHCDWQDIRIRVTGDTTLETGVGCYYEGLAEGTSCTSLEDPIVLETTGTPGTFAWTSPGPAWTRFERIPSRATIPDDVFEYRFQEIAKTHGLCADPQIDPGCDSAPTLENVRRSKILWIKDFLVQHVFGEEIGQKSFALDAGGMPKAVPMDVFECVPYSNSSNPPYPYNLPGDPFTADHTCCTTGGKYEERGKPCYKGDTFGPPPIRGRDLGADPSILVEMHDDAANDIFQKTVQHLCSGTRGNICDGEKSETRGAAALAACRDFVDENQVERCVGPNIITYECKEYKPGESFEKEFGLQKKDRPMPADGNCSGIADYADDGGAGMFDPTTESGPFRCDGQCNAGSCSYAANCVCDSTSPSGGGNNACDGITYSALAASAGRGVANAKGTVWCSTKCRVVTPDESEAACRAAISRAGRTWESLSYSSGRPAGQRCCGDESSEFLPDGPGNACCSVRDSCVIGSACVAPGETTPDGKYYCDGGVSKLCGLEYGRNVVGECAQVGSMWCDGERWSEDQGSPIEGRVCGRGDLCARCKNNPNVGRIECQGVHSNCQASAPVCRLVDTSFQCKAS